MSGKIVFSPGAFFHGTKADLQVGELLTAGFESNYEPGRLARYVYFAGTLEPAVWGAELAAGQGRQRIYVVEPTGDFEDDPNVTDMKFAGNPTKSYRSREALRIIGEVCGWRGHSPEALAAMREKLRKIREQGLGIIE